MSIRLKKLVELFRNTATFIKFSVIRREVTHLHDALLPAPSRAKGFLRRAKTQSVRHRGKYPCKWQHG